jgi:uncharacterized protein
MLSIESYFSKANAFSRLFESSADEVRKSAVALVESLKSPAESIKLEDLSRIRQQNRVINEEISKLLCQSFITPLEREDLDALSRTLYRIPKTIEKFVERMMLLKSRQCFEFFDHQAKILEQATNVVFEMMQQLWHRPQLEKIKLENDRLHALESEADKLVVEMLRELFSGKHEPMEVLVLRDLFDLLEKTIDCCRNAGNVIFHVVLKNS